MYDSPIDKFYGEMKSKIVENEEGQLMVQVSQAIGYSINKYELIKALNYDRHQYEKGYEDGLNAGRKEITEEMTDTDRIKSIIAKSLESANNEEIADAYENTVSCGDCPYRSDCRNEHDCFEYILDKLENAE